MHTTTMTRTLGALGAALALAAPSARADGVTDWNTKAGELIVEAKLGTPPATRVIAIVQTAVLQALRTVDRRDPGAVDAAIAAANRAVLARLLPQQAAAVQTAYQGALDRIADGPVRRAGIAAGEAAAESVLAARATDGAAGAETYRPHAAPGAYVPTAAVAAPQWPQRKPWLLPSADAVRPGPPPALSSAQWARDYAEIQAVGARNSTLRTPEQTEIARFWEYSLPPIYHAVLRSAAQAPGRDVLRNAQLFATAAQAMDDALIAVLDAKYHYGFWRPATAIRNGDIDDNPATVAEPGWTSLIDAPLHPEYPSAHSILAGTIAAVLQGDFGTAPLPELSTSSPTAKGATRRWQRVDDFVQEVANARVWEGIHFRTSTEVGSAMGRHIGALAARKTAWLPAPAVPQALAPAPGAQLLERVSARGVQIYECRTDGAGAAWIFVAPEAELFDAQGHAIGRHDAGPHWAAADGSRILGRVEARADAPLPGDIPWLLLSARSVGGSGRFAAVTSVQRVNTQGGHAPTGGCDASSRGTTDRVPYSADYLLYAAS